MHPDGSDKRKLLVDQPTFRLISPQHPTWSPDGTKIAFVAIKVPLSGGETENDLWVMNADGSELRSVAAAGNGGVSWSPDGSQLAYTRKYLAYGNERRYVAVVSADGLSGHTIAGAESFDPAWSPDGRTIVFGTELPALEAANPDGTGRRVLIYFSAAQPDWSPDGSKLLFNNTDPQVGEIYAANADGSGMRVVYSHGGSTPAWSPDGVKIVFNDAGAIQYLRLDGTTSNPGPALVSGQMPDWQPCGAGVRCPVTAACVVPRVTGLSLQRARTAIRRGGCAVGRIRRRKHVRTPKAIVSKQSPRPGTRLPRGGKVNLILRSRR